MKTRAAAAVTPVKATSPEEVDAARWHWLTTRPIRGTDAPSFFYAVRTTGIFCRPGCPARLPRRENVCFYSTAAEALHAGFRPCQRCLPTTTPTCATPHAAVIAQACEALEHEESPPTLKTLAQAAGLSPFQFHRAFVNALGLTPKAYAEACRARRWRAVAQRQPNVTAALYEAGYASSRQFYTQVGPHLGMTPKRYQAGGRGETIRFALGECSLGTVLTASTARGVCAVWLGDDPEVLLHELQERFPHAQLIGGDATYERTIAQVVGLVENPRQPLNLPLDVRGTAFQHRVWRALQAIPAGETRSYAELAQALGLPRAARAVGHACGANLLAVAIPCHRVVRADGGLSGYRWGVERKLALLEREAEHP